MRAMRKGEHFAGKTALRQKWHTPCKSHADTAFYPNGKFFPNCLIYMLVLVCFGGFTGIVPPPRMDDNSYSYKGKRRWLDSRFLVWFCRQSLA